MPLHLLEPHARLSRSKLWDLQRKFYLDKGPTAWTEGVVPFLASTHAGTARDYATLIAAWMHDHRDALDPSAPLYIVELGTGSGRLAYLLARALIRARPVMPRAAPKPCVVATDISEDNLRWVEDHPSMAPLIDAGFVDFAMFDAEAPGPIALWRSGAVLEPGALRNPVVVIASYVLDTLRCDAFRVQDGVLTEVFAALGRDETTDGDDDDLDRYDVDVDERPVEGPVYGDEVLDGLLDGYRDALDGSGVNLPMAAIDTVRYFAGFGVPLLLLVGDKAYRTHAELDGRGVVGLVKHGSFSLSVNLHAIGEVVRALGGVPLFEYTFDTAFNHAVFAVPAVPEQLTHTRIAFRSVDAFGPRGAQKVVYELSRGESPTPRAAVLLIKLGGYDTFAFRKFFPVVREALRSGDHTLITDTWEMLERVVENDYPLGGRNLIAFQIARGWHTLREPARAEAWYRKSLDRDGPISATWFNMGLCRVALGDTTGAREAFRQAIACDPDNQAAQDELATLA